MSFVLARRTTHAHIALEVVVRHVTRTTRAVLLDGFVLDVVLGGVRVGERVHYVHALAVRVVDLHEWFPLLGQRVLREDRLDRAFRFAGAAVNALLRIDHEDPSGLVDAVHGADVDAGAVFDVDAGLGDDVRHGDLLYRREQRINQFTRPFEERGFCHDLVEPRGVSAPQSLSIGVVRVAEDRYVGVAVSHVVRVDSRDVGNHEVRWLDPICRLEAMLRQERLELAPDEEVDPAQEDRRHA